MAYIGRRGPIVRPPDTGGGSIGTAFQSPDTRARVNRAQGNPYSIDVPDPRPSEPTTTTQKIGNQLTTTTTQNIRGGVEEDLGQQTFIYGDPSRPGTEQSGGLDETMYDYGTDSGFGPDYMEPADTGPRTIYLPPMQGGREVPMQEFEEEINNINQILNGLYWLEMEGAQGY